MKQVLPEKSCLIYASCELFGQSIRIYSTCRPLLYLFQKETLYLTYGLQTKYISLFIFLSIIKICIFNW